MRSSATPRARARGARRLRPRGAGGPGASHRGRSRRRGRSSRTSDRAAFVRAMQTLRVRRHEVARAPRRSVSRRPDAVASSRSADRPASAAPRSRCNSRVDRAAACWSTPTTSRPRSRRGLGLPIEPNLRTAIDAVEHGRGDLLDSLAMRSQRRASRYWRVFRIRRRGSQVRPGEVVRRGRAARRRQADVVVADGVGSLEDVGGPPRGRYAVARALVGRSRRRGRRCAPRRRSAWRGSRPGPSRSRATRAGRAAGRRREPGAARARSGGASSTTS